jgi:hypothetical protein
MNLRAQTVGIKITDFDVVFGFYLGNAFSFFCCALHIIVVVLSFVWRFLLAAIVPVAVPAFWHWVGN